MASKERKRISTRKLNQARAMYMEYKTLGEISRALDIPKTSLSYHVNKKWKADRQIQRMELFDAMSDAKKEHFAGIANNTVVILSRALNHLVTREEPPSVVEAQKAADIMSTLDKIIRLDENRPTEVTATSEAPVTIEVIQEKMSYDPFSEQKTIEEIDYEEDD